MICKYVNPTAHNGQYKIKINSFIKLIYTVCVDTVINNAEQAEQNI